MKARVPKVPIPAADVAHAVRSSVKIVARMGIARLCRIGTKIRGNAPPKPRSGPRWSGAIQRRRWSACEACSALGGC